MGDSTNSCYLKCFPLTSGPGITGNLLDMSLKTLKKRVYYVPGMILDIVYLDLSRAFTIAVYDILVEQIWLDEMHIFS